MSDTIEARILVKHRIAVKPVSSCLFKPLDRLICFVHQGIGARDVVFDLVKMAMVDFSPLAPGLSYQVWLVGVNSRGEGPISNKTAFTA